MENIFGCEFHTTTQMNLKQILELNIKVQTVKQEKKKSFNPCLPQKKNFLDPTPKIN